MNNLAVFEFDSQKVRVILVEGDPWFVAQDVCEIWTVTNVGDALSRLDDDEKAELTGKNLIGLTDNPSVARLSIVSESGLYSLVLSSRKPEAKPFKKWVTHEVLPSIRKTGYYASDRIDPQDSLNLLFDQMVDTLLITPIDSADFGKVARNIVELGVWRGRRGWD